MERDGQSLKQIADWLAANHGITVSVPTMSRRLAVIRAAAPPLPPPAPDLLPATDEDELATMRRHFRAQVYKPGQSLRDQRDAAKLLLAIMAEQRERRVGPQPVLPVQPAVTLPGAPQLSAEEEAEQVAAYLGKAN